MKTKVNNTENNKENKSLKKAISLIVLVITIIVLAILASAVIISISNTNIMEKGTQTNFKADMQNLKSKYSMWLANYIAENEVYDINTINYAAGNSEFLNQVMGGEVPVKYQGGLKVINGKLYYDTEEEEKNTILAEIDMKDENKSTPVTNPHANEQWDYAWAYNPTDGWGDRLTSGDVIPENTTITAKFYANGETVTPTSDQLIINLGPGDAYDMVIEGTGEMGYLWDVFFMEDIYAWIKEIIEYADDETAPIPISCYVTDMVITDGITSIGSAAFMHCCVLTTTTISNSVTSIGNNAFFNCTNLETITLPSSVTSIGLCTFQACTSLTTVTIPSSVTSIGSCAFRDCTNLLSVNIPNSITSISSSTFNLCKSLTTITIPNSVTFIGSDAFSHCKNLETVIIPNSVITIDEYAFYDCTNLSSVTIPSSVTSIGEYAFYNVPHIYYSGSATGSPWGALAIN